MCQSDNQVVLLKYKHNQLDKKEAIRRQFLTKLSENFITVNLKHKLQETSYSKRLFEYGKVRFIDGVSIGQGTKKAARLIPDINDGLASFHSSLSTINTVTESIGKADLDPDSAFFMNQFHIINYLERKDISQKRITLTIICSFCFIPQTLEVSLYPSTFLTLSEVLTIK